MLIPSALPIGSYVENRETCVDLSAEGFSNSKHYVKFFNLFEALSRLAMIRQK